MKTLNVKALKLVDCFIKLDGMKLPRLKKKKKTETKLEASRCQAAKPE